VLNRLRPVVRQRAVLVQGHDPADRPARGWGASPRPARMWPGAPGSARGARDPRWPPSREWCSPTTSRNSSPS